MNEVRTAYAQLQVHVLGNVKSLRKTESGGSDQGVLKAAAEAIEAAQQEHEELERKDARGSRASYDQATAIGKYALINVWSCQSGP